MLAACADESFLIDRAQKELHAKHRRHVELRDFSDVDGARYYVYCRTVRGEDVGSPLPSGRRFGPCVTFRCATGATEAECTVE
jgi:hypothetical protein